MQRACRTRTTSALRVKIRGFSDFVTRIFSARCAPFSSENSKRTSTEPLESIQVSATTRGGAATRRLCNSGELEMKFSKVFAFACPLLLSLAATSANAATNPAGIAFSKETNVSLYGKPTGLLIAGRCNRYEPEFAAARSKGAEVLAYLNPASRPDAHVCSLDKGFYMNNYGAVPLWPYPSYA